jgi:hypothetical protein
MRSLAMGWRGSMEFSMGWWLAIESFEFSPNYKLWMYFNLSCLFIDRGFGTNVFCFVGLPSIAIGKSSFVWTRVQSLESMWWILLPQNESSMKVTIWNFRVFYFEVCINLTWLWAFRVLTPSTLLWTNILKLFTRILVHGSIVVVFPHPHDLCSILAISWFLRVLSLSNLLKFYV